MNEVLADLVRWQRQKETIALATLVGVQGSAPRAPGARFCVTKTGKVSGSVSGGCIEADLVEHALQVLDSDRPKIIRYSISDELGFSVGLSCGGQIDVLVEPFRSGATWKAVRDSLQSQRPVALATSLSPISLLGRKLVIFADGTYVGGVDSELDAELTTVAHKHLLEGGTRQLVFSLQGEESRVFLEAFLPPPHVIVVGAAFAAPSLARIAKDVGFRVTVVDPRAAFATRERFPTADEVIVAWPDEALKKIGLDAYSYVVVLLHDAKFDIAALAPALRSDARYIGVMGSRRVQEQRRARLREQGFSDEVLARMHAPVGLDLGGREPGEIAVSILAEIIAVSHCRNAPALSPAGAVHTAQVGTPPAAPTGPARPFEK